MPCHDPDTLQISESGGDATEPRQFRSSKRVRPLADWPKAMLGNPLASQGRADSQLVELSHRDHVVVGFCELGGDVESVVHRRQHEPQASQGSLDGRGSAGERGYPASGPAEAIDSCTTVFLKALTLKGFKSFAEATTMHLEPGVTVVVGPNGSGKSNVVDAIAWVLGAQAPSAVRSQKMDDVIFAGTSKRAALGRAEVGLTIDNSSGILPIEFSEVTITRTLFRTGDSEYAINGAPCRLLDIQELLSDAGVGRQQHVIVSQGQIDAVLNARPEDRRSIIEEAAGVLKFRRRKEKAERRLDSTEANLTRVQDLLREVRRQLRPLERQAEAARRHGDLVAELGSLRLYLAGREIAGLRTRLGILANQHGVTEAEEIQLRAELARLDTEVMACEAELSARGHTDVGDSLVRVEQLRERARGLANVIVERRRSVERDRGALMNEGVVANLEAEAASAHSQLAEVTASIEAIAPQAEQLAEDEEAFAADRDSSQPITPVAKRDGSANAAAEVRGELRSLSNGVNSDDAEQRRVSSRAESLRRRAEQLSEDIDKLKIECEQAEGAEAPIVAELEIAEVRRQRAEAGLAAIEEARQTAASDSAGWRARADALGMALDSARARAGAERVAGLDGVLGTLLDLVEVDEDWGQAFEAAAGEALLAVVVDDPDAGRRALAHLRQADAFGAVLALGVVRAHQQELLTDDCVRHHVRSSDRRVSALLDSLLGDAIRVVSWESAVDAVVLSPLRIAVTPDGHRFGPSGWRLGAAGGGATAAALDDARQRADEAAEELARRSTALSAAKAELLEAQADEQELLRRLEAHDTRFSAAADQLARSLNERGQVAADLESLELVQTGITDRATLRKHRIEELTTLLPGLEADEAAEADAARLRGQRRAQMEFKARELATRRKDLEVRNAGLNERKQYLERRIIDVERRLEADVVARAAAAERRVHVERVLIALDRIGALVQSHRNVLDSEHQRLNELRRRQSDEVRVIAQRLDASRKRRTAAEKQMEELRERERRNEIEHAEVRTRLEAAIDGLRRDLDVEPDVAMAAAAPSGAESANPSERARELERELRLLGPINPLALEEFTALQERHAFLEAQLEDVKSTRRDLMRVIKAVDQEIQSVFATAFADVSENFTGLFSMLFPGGAGKLILTNPDDMLNTGIEVEAKPSGKNVKKLSLLSGGERSLTALAFLFAVFRSRPSPFYVMDEVEAALDDVNLHRFLGLIAEFRDEAQLLIVSHQKRTMEAADCLLGVTMQPGGSSKVIVEKAAALRD